MAGVFTPGTFYQSEFQEVLKKGALTGHTRTPDETVQANFWAYDGVDKIGTPPRFYCQIALAILDAFAAAPGSTVGVPDYVRLLALMTAGMADAGIQAWHWKYQYDFWRPVVGIREADPSYGPAAPTPGKTVKGHPDWIPLGAPMTNQGRRFTPPFPAYPSGHATFGSTAFQVIRLYAEGRGLATTPVPPPAEPDKIGFSIVSDELDGTNRDPDGGLRPRHRRQFNSLWEATLENSASRIFLGVHWRFDGMSKKDAAGHAVFGKPDKPGDLGDIGGIWLGREIANDLMTNGLKHV